MSETHSHNKTMTLIHTIATVRGIHVSQKTLNLVRREEIHVVKFSGRHAVLLNYNERTLL